MSMKKSSVLVALLLALGSQTFANELTKVTLALNWVPEPEFGGFYAAKEKKFYEKHGLNVDIVVGGAGSPTIQMVAAKKVQFAVTSGGEVIISRARGADVEAIYSVYQKSPLMIMAHESRHLKSLADVFKSGTIALERGLAFAVFLEKKYGYSKVKAVPYTGGVANFLHDPMFAQQGFATSEPLLARREGGDPQVFLIADDGFDPYMETVTINRQYAASQPSVVKAFVEATREGWEFYLKNPDEINAMMGKLNKAMDAKTFREAAEAQVPFVVSEDTKKHGLGWMSAEHWKKETGQFKDLKLVDKIFPPESYFQNF
jgi:NitT/TauT family transport system substrate-binding protein